MSAPTVNPNPPSLPVNVDNATETARVAKEFVREFNDRDVKLKPAMVKNNRCLALAYIDARAVMDRLDLVVGIGGWQDAYTVLANGSVECRLAVWIAGAWVTKSDVGSESEQPDDGDRTKAAYSDAFKRAAVKFGIGRYLYRMPQQWMDYDPGKKQIVRPNGGQQTQGPEPAPPKTEAPKPAPAPPPEPVSESAREIAAALDGAKSRADGTAPWKRYEAAQTANRVSTADKAHIEAAFKRFGLRFPANKATGAKS